LSSRNNSVVLGIFKKTELGTREVATRAHGLRAELRRLLILIDGNRPAESLIPLFRGNEFSTLLFELLSHGMIEPATLVSESGSAMNAVSESEYTLLTGAQLRGAVSAAVNAAHELLGNKAKPWIKKLEACRDSYSLRQIVGELLAELRGILGDDAALLFVETVREGARKRG
jgi:hypothetical protein